MTSRNQASIVDLSARFLGVLLRPDLNPGTTKYGGYTTG